MIVSIESTKVEESLDFHLCVFDCVFACVCVCVCVCVSCGSYVCACHGHVRMNDVDRKANTPLVCEHKNLIAFICAGMQPVPQENTLTLSG
jgi:hypothetical protein